MMSALYIAAVCCVRTSEVRHFGSTKYKGDEMPAVLEIICLEQSDREKFRILESSVPGWGMERVHYVATDLVGLFKVRRLGVGTTMVVVRDFLSAQVSPLEALLATLHTMGVKDTHIVVLEGSETPEQIDNLVREKFAALLYSDV